MLPNFIWRLFNKSASIDIAKLNKHVISLDSFNSEEREITIDQIARHIHLSLELKCHYLPFWRQMFNMKSCVPLGPRHGNFLFLAYLFTKFIYLLNLIANIFLMNFLFGFQHYGYGFDFLKRIFTRDDYSRLDQAFPRITFCDFKIRNMGDNMHQHSVQCALPINLFNEKFFILLWFWLVVLTFITFLNIFGWFKYFFYFYRKNLFAKYLNTHKKLNTSEKETDMLGSFVNLYLGLDGAFVIAILRRNGNHLTTSEIVCAMFAKFKSEFTKPVIFDHESRSKIAHGNIED